MGAKFTDAQFVYCVDFTGPRISARTSLAERIWGALFDAMCQASSLSIGCSVMALGYVAAPPEGTTAPTSAVEGDFV